MVGEGGVGRRVMVEDARRDGTFMRVTWHQESRVFVVSHWDGTLCVAATRVSPEAVPELVAVLVGGLAGSAVAETEPRRIAPRGIAARLRAAWRTLTAPAPGPSSAQDDVTVLHHRRSA